MKNSLLLCAAGLLLLTGCETRSISDSGYQHGYRYGSSSSYRGERTEFDVLGVNQGGNISEADIAAAFQNRTAVRLARTSKLLVIQSGAGFPDTAMMDALGSRFAPAPFSGVPAEKAPGKESTYAHSLRLTAAQGGYDKILCYWGILESARIDQATKGISWVPLVGAYLPDENQTMRIRLKAVLIDTVSGQWTMLQPDPVTDKQLNSRFTREKSDQQLVAKLKDAGYKSMASLLANGFTD